jgi:hypothetical protein
MLGVFQPTTALSMAPMSLQAGFQMVEETGVPGGNNRKQ